VLTIDSLTAEVNASADSTGSSTTDGSAADQDLGGEENEAPDTTESSVIGVEAITSTTEPSVTTTGVPVPPTLAVVQTTESTAPSSSETTETTVATTESQPEQATTASTVPVTAPQTTQAPTTKAPTTQAPTTKAPTTKAPTTTGAHSFPNIEVTLVSDGSKTNLGNLAASMNKPVLFWFWQPG